MKKKVLTFLLAICFMLPCAFIMTACNSGRDGDGNTPTLTGYEIYINGAKTNEFECVIGQNAITSNNVVVKSSWSDSSKNSNVPLDNFDITCLWNDQNNEFQTTIPDFWTNGTGSTINDCATAYEFTLTLKSDNAYSVNFVVIIKPERVTNLKVRIFDGDNYSYSAEMIWRHNDRELDPEKQFRFNIENLDAEYDKQEHIQWALIEKENYDGLNSSQKKELIQSGHNFSTTQIDNSYAPGTYYIFAYVPDWNNKQYGIDGDGRIYDYATLTILPIEIEREKLTHTFDYNNTHIRENTTYYLSGLDIIGEIKNIEEGYINYKFYGFNDNEWSSILNYDTEIKVHAVKENDVYKWVVLKDVNTNLTEWVYVNNDGTRSNNVVADNSKIELVDYTELEYYTNNSQITIPIYYMINDMSEQGLYYDCSNMYETSLTIKKILMDYVPQIKAGSNEYITKDNHFELYYNQYSLELVILQTVCDLNAFGYSLINDGVWEYTEENQIAYITTGNPNVAWKLDGVSYCSRPIQITYHVNKCEINRPECREIEGKIQFAGGYIEVLYDSTLQNYIIRDFINVGDFVQGYCYALKAEDADLTEAQLINKIKVFGKRVFNISDDVLTDNSTNQVGRTFIILYDLESKQSSTWTGGSTNPIMIKVRIVNSFS